jgi:uncharacterized protein DUF3592
MTSIVLLCIGALVTAASATALWRTFKLRLLGRQATGTLVDWQRTFHHKWLGNGRFTQTRRYFPVVRFETADGSTRRVVSNLGYDPKPDWPAGRPFTVRYDPGDPNEATVDPISSTWVFPAVFAVAGLVVLCAGLRSYLSS